MVLASNAPVGGILALALLGIVSVGAGLAIITNWRGWGTRTYRFTIRLRLPGAGFYRNWGYGTYRAFVGGGYIAMGSVFLIAATLICTTRWNA